MCSTQSGKIEILEDIIEKLLCNPNEKHEWNKNELEVMSRLSKKNDLRNWFHRRGIFAAYLQQEHSKDEYVEKMIEWESNNPKPITAIE